jgi:hypothetical protein
MMVHRVVAIRNNNYLTKGDSCFEPDGLTRAADILGCVVRIERNNRNVSFGLGLERIGIAFLSKNGLLRIILSLSQLTPKSLKKLIKYMFLRK